MYTVVPETWITLDATLFGENVIVLALQMPNDLRERSLVVDLVTETGGIHNSKRNPSAFFVKLELYRNWLNPDSFFQMGADRVIRIFGLKDSLAAQCIDEGGAASARSTADHEAELNSLFDILLPSHLNLVDCCAVSSIKAEAY